ncbi:dihydrofolate reductase family protein [Vibrio owensii]|nr:dihydrofolate reductase family protein [Vibrio owensii]
MKVVAYMAQSLDGYIAGVNGELDWLDEIENPDKNDFGFADFMLSIDALLMGKNTYQKVASFGFWPYEKTVYIASNSLLHIDSELADKAQLLTGDLPEMLLKLKSEGIKKVYIDGGMLIQNAIDLSVLNEITVTTIPVILGNGISLFGTSNKKTKLKFESSEVLLNQLVKTKYSVIVA